MRFLVLLSLSMLARLSAQEITIPVADQTFRMDGTHEFAYAFAEGDELYLQVQELSGREIKSVEFLQHPDYLIFRAYELDSLLTQKIPIQKTGVYLLRFKESGLGKKICRFILKRSPMNLETARLDTRVGWNIQEQAAYRVGKRSIQVGKKLETVPTSGQVHVAASKFYTKKPVNAWQFTLPPNTVQWAYRIAVGQNGQVARQEDAQKLTRALQTGGAKLLGTLPETALAAFALGMAIDMTVSKAGEDVEYAVVDYENWTKFAKSVEYQSFIYQGAVSVDVQRRYAPLSGTYYFALRSDNWMDDIDVTIDIEAVVETPLFETEIYLEPIRP
jgi:hypothetical protein